MNNLLSRTFSRLTPVNVDDVEAGDVGLEMQNQDMAQFPEFLDEVSIIRNEMGVVEQLLKKLQEANEESKTIHKAVAMKALRDRMDQDVKEVSKNARAIKGKLEDLDRKNGGDRSKMANIANLRQKLKDDMDEFSTLRTQIMADYKEVIERRYFTVTGTQPDAETLDHIIDTGESENFLQRAIQEQGRGQVIDTIKEIQERHDGVKEIEKNLLELQQIFLDMQVLVTAQGDQINNIQANVERAQSYVVRGTKQFQIAKTHQRNSRRWCFFSFILLIIIILVIVLAILIALHVI